MSRLDRWSSPQRPTSKTNRCTGPPTSILHGCWSVPIKPRFGDCRHGSHGVSVHLKQQCRLPSATPSAKSATFFNASTTTNRRRVAVCEHNQFNTARGKWDASEHSNSTFAVQHSPVGWRYDCSEWPTTNIKHFKCSLLLSSCSTTPVLTSTKLSDSISTTTNIGQYKSSVLVSSCSTTPVPASTKISDSISTTTSNSEFGASSSPIIISDGGKDTQSLQI
ncbi:hypothetical protein BLNAU_12744 [Blattamonas nauphoetae]|uniref:Uncharacterized protein n=1 Tax=Blattamonas nauphoetae TaxID=2049346 RepID=A0ABQ9XLI2_9EUKA|nr:hypothetical protein BLNAU_12744 [Blattamonas nauphoetae]